MGQGELVEEFRIGPRQIDGHGACRFIADDAAFKRAGRWLFQAFVGADDDGVEAAGRRA